MKVPLKPLTVVFFFFIRYSYIALVQVMGSMTNNLKPQTLNPKTKAQNLKILEPRQDMAARRVAPGRPDVFAWRGGSCRAAHYPQQDLGCLGFSV